MVVLKYTCDVNPNEDIQVHDLLLQQTDQEALFAVRWVLEADMLLHRPDCIKQSLKQR